MCSFGEDSGKTARLTVWGARQVHLPSVLSFGKMEELKAAVTALGRNQTGDSLFPQPQGFCHGNNSQTRWLTNVDFSIMLWNGHSSALGCGLTMGWLLASSCSGTRAAGATPTCNPQPCDREQKHKRLSQAMHSSFSPLLGNGVCHAHLNFVGQSKSHGQSQTVVL